MSVSTAPILSPAVQRERWFSCARKRVVYATRDKAEKAVRLRTKFDHDNKIEARPWNAYHCAFCGSYHIGHVRKVEPCGLCDVPHRCHCPRLKSWCDACPALGVG